MKFLLSLTVVPTSKVAVASVGQALSNTQPMTQASPPVATLGSVATADQRDIPRGDISRYAKIIFLKNSYVRASGVLIISKISNLAQFKRTPRFL